jgi:two-component system sensor histidine kinase KdpD
MTHDESQGSAAQRSVRVGGVTNPGKAERAALPATLDREAFLGVLSHELRTPVTTIYGGAQLLATRDLPESRRRALASDVSQEAERLFRIVEDLVVLLRSERGELESADEPVAISRLIVSAIERELRRDPGLQIRYLGDGDAAAEQADELLVAHAVRNLLDNAIRNAGGRGPVEVVVDSEGDEVVIRVLDRGPEPVELEEGAGPDGTNQIDPTATLAGRAGGGLGLFVAARLIHAMRGRSWVQARPGGGAELGFALRRSLAPARRASA